MNGLEDSLRAMFAAKADRPPPSEDLATNAIRRGRRRRRGRALTSGLASVLVLMLVLSGAVTLRTWWEPAQSVRIAGPVHPGPAPSSASPSPDEPRWNGGELGIELRAANELWTADGGQVMLNGTGLVERAYRTRHGWVYGTADHVRLLRPDGVPVDLVRGAADWVIGPGGRRLAYAAVGATWMATIRSDGLGDPTLIEAADGAVPVAFAGDRMVLAAVDRPAYGLWDPAEPATVRWSPAGDLAAVYGEYVGGLLGLVRADDRYCLVSLAVADGWQERQRGGCDLGLSPAAAGPGPAAAPPTGWLGPDGRWLAVPTAGELRLVDVAAALTDSPADPVTCPAYGPVTPVWWDATTVLGTDADGAVRCAVDGRREPVPVPAALGPRWQFVPVLGVAR